MAAHATMHAVLTATRRPGIRGVGAASLLLTDGAGPVFTPHPPDALQDAAIRAAAAVEAG
jgi:hypothetical protein